MGVALENRVTTESERNKRRVQEVNSLLRKAFGRPIPFIYGIKGNFDVCYDEMGSPTTLDHLKAIHKTLLFGGIQIGEFTDKDGSSIRLIGDKYLKEARRYAELYRAKYGKDVQIEFNSKYNPRSVI